MLFHSFSIPAFCHSSFSGLGFYYFHNLFGRPVDYVLSRSALLSTTWSRLVGVGLVPWPQTSACCTDPPTSKKKKSRSGSKRKPRLQLGLTWRPKQTAGIPDTSISDMYDGCRAPLHPEGGEGLQPLSFLGGWLGDAKETPSQRDKHQFIKWMVQRMSFWNALSLSEDQRLHSSERLNTSWNLF